MWDTGGGEVEWGGGGWGDAAGSGGGWGDAAGSGDNSSGAAAGGGETGWGNTDEGPAWGNASEETVWATGPLAGESAGNAMDVDEPLPQPYQLGGSASQPSGRIAADPLTSVRQEFSKVLGEERKGNDEDDGIEHDSDTDDDDDMGEPNDPESLPGKRQASRRYLKYGQPSLRSFLLLLPFLSIQIGLTRSLRTESSNELSLLNSNSPMHKSLVRDGQKHVTLPSTNIQAMPLALFLTPPPRNTKTR